MTRLPPCRSETVTPITEEDITANDPLASVSIEDGGGGDTGGGEDEIAPVPGSQETGEDDSPGDGGAEEGSGEESPGAGSSGEESSGEESGQEGEGESSEQECEGESGSQEESGETQEPGQLVLAERYRDVYLFWMKAMYYWHMGEYETYQNEKAMFDEAWARLELDVCFERHMGTGG